MASQRENLGEVGGDRFETSKGCRLVDLKNIHSLKSESYVFFLVGIFRTSGPGDRISGNHNRADREEVREETGYIKEQVI